MDINNQSECACKSFLLATPHNHTPEAPQRAPPRLELGLAGSVEHDGLAGLGESDGLDNRLAGGFDQVGNGSALRALQSLSLCLPLRSRPVCTVVRGRVAFNFGQTWSEPDGYIMLPHRSSPEA